MIETLRSLIDGSTFDGYLARSWQPQSLADLDRWMDFESGGAPSYAGNYVSATSAMQVSAVWACVRVRSEDWATLPLITYRRGPDETRERARDHYLYKLLRYRANPEMSAWRFKRQMQMWVDIHGNAYAEIEISGRGQVTALWPWRPDRTKVDRKVKGGPLVYTYRMENGEEVSVPGDNMLHLRGLEANGVMGIDPVTAHRQRFGLSMAMEEHSCRFFSNGARPMGVLEHPLVLGDEGQIRVRKMWEATHGGLSNAHRVAILEEGMKYQETGLSMVNAQFLELGNFGIEDIARIYNVPPHRIQHLLRSTNNNIEHQGLEYGQYTQGPIAGNWESEIMMSLLSEREAQTIFVEANFDNILRGDAASRAEYLTAKNNAGALTPDEWRAIDNQNPLPNGMGAKPRVPLNTIPADQPQPDKTAPKRYVNGHAAEIPEALL